MALGIRRNGKDANVAEAELRGMAEQLEIAVANGELLQEDLQRLELALDEAGWRRLNFQVERDFSRAGLDDMMRISRAMYLSHPLIQRAVNVRSYYTWGQGVSFKANDEKVQDIVDQMTGDEANRLEMYSHQATLLTDVDQQCDGNVFQALFINGDGEVSIRSMPAEEIREIYTDPDDYCQRLYYHRVWNQNRLNEATGQVDTEQKEALYPDLTHNPKKQPDKIGNIEVRWDARVIHQRTGGLKQMRFGVPETYAALDWARAYKKFLEDWHTLVRSLAAFAWKATVKGRNVKKTKDRLEAPQTKSVPPGDGPAEPGSVWVGNEGADMTPMPKMSGAVVSAEDAKPSRLMVASSMDLPDTILSSDPQQGNLATARSLDRPTELGMRTRQILWGDHHAKIFRWAVDENVRMGKLSGSKVIVDGREYIEPGVDAAVAVNFPPILEHDPLEQVRALVAAATLEGKTEAGTMPHEELARRLMAAVGVEDVSAAIEALDKEEQDQLTTAVERLAEALR